MLNPRTDVGAHAVGVAANAQRTAAGAAIALVAGATEDGVKVNGLTINRLNAMSCELEITGVATLAATETLSMAVEYQESGDGTTWDTAVTLQASTVVATGQAGGSNEAVEVSLPLKLKPRKKYIRFNITPTMSASATDTAVWSATCVLAGFDVLPAAQATA